MHIHTFKAVRIRAHRGAEIAVTRYYESYVVHVFYLQLKCMCSVDDNEKQAVISQIVNPVADYYYFLLNDNCMYITC